MPSFSRLSAIGFSALAGGAYYFWQEKITASSFGHGNDTGRDACLIVQNAVCADIGTLSSFPSIHPSPQSKWDYNWDNREPKYMVNQVKYENADPESQQNMLNEATPTAKRNIILIRHGQYTMDRNDKNYLSLTPLGQEQAKCVGERLAKSGVKFDSLAMSTMARATETAKLILEQLPSISTTRDPLLEEGAPYPPEPPSKNWHPKYKGSRIEAAFRKYVHRASRKQKEESWELIVCHGNVIRYFVCRALQFPPEGWLRMSVGHCSITWLVIYPNGIVSVRSLGDIGHLPREKVSF